MASMKSIIQFQISESDGGYVAEGVSVPIVTQGETLDELAANIREAVGLYVEGENLAELGFYDRSVSASKLRAPDACTCLNQGGFQDLKSFKYSNNSVLQSKVKKGAT